MPSEATLAAEGAGVARAIADFKVSERYRTYVLWLLFTVYVFNFVDRSILTILMQPIKEEFRFSDTEMGLLGGLAFALLYCTLGIPIARRADKGNRVLIISLSLLVWSVSTAFTGFARNFTQLLLGRVAVGIGEAGCSPPAYSLLSDYFEPKRRSTALAISYNIAVMLFGGFAQFFVTWLIEATGTPIAPAYYLMFGAAVGLLAALFLRERARDAQLLVTDVVEPTAA